MNNKAQKTHPLHIHKWNTFLSVIFEDAAIRVDDIVESMEWGRGRVKEVFFGGKGPQCLVHFFDAGDRLVRRADLILKENGWVEGPIFSGDGKRIRHDEELRALMNAKKKV
jgi:hypothetical protein